MLGECEAETRQRVILQLPPLEETELLAVPSASSVSPENGHEGQHNDSIFRDRCQCIMFSCRSFLRLVMMASVWSLKIHSKSLYSEYYEIFKQIL